MQWRLVATGAVITVGCAGGLVGHYMGTVLATAQQQTAQQQANQAEQEAQNDAAHQRARLLPASPLAVLQLLLTAISKEDATRACLVFTPTGAAEFADVVGTADCPSAIHALAKQITDRASYRVPDIPEDAYGYGISTTITGCTADYSSPFSTATDPHPGPLLGVMTVDQPLLGVAGYEVTSYRPCP